MASKTLVLASKRASMPEIYQNHAFYFDPHHLEDIVQAITQAANLNPVKRQQLIKTAHHHAQQFSWKKTALTTLKVYEDCLGLRSS